MEPLDLYCERLAPGLAGEPFNALTNVAFFIAAWGVWRLARRTATLGTEAWVLIALIAAIGVGSTLFHAYANTATHVLDTTPILVFQIAFLWYYARRALRWGPAGALVSVVLFLAAGGYTKRFPELLNGSFTYSPALVAVLALGVAHYRVKLAGRWDLIGAAALLGLSLFLRTIDLAVCDAIPVGTHFLWHLLNALVLYVCARALLCNVGRNYDPSRPPS